MPLPSIIKGSIQKLALHLSYILLLFSTLILIGDDIYFGIVMRHSYHDFYLLIDEASSIASLLIKDYSAVLLAFSLFLITTLFLWLKYWKLLFVVSNQKSPVTKQILILTLALLLLLLCWRGFDIESKPLRMVEVYQGNNEQQANLILNGIYTSAKGLTQRYKPNNYQFFKPEELARNAINEGIESIEQPFTKKYSDNKPNRRNLMIILLESIDYKYIDSLANNNYGATPFLDELTLKSQVYDNFYATGQRSYYGIQAILFGLPPLHGLGFVGGGLELSRLSKLGKIANNNGYETFMLQSSKRESIRLDSIASYAQFNHYLGKSDFPLLRDDYPNPNGAVYGWDYEMLMKNLSLVNNTNKPFLSFAFTGTTHQPFAEPPKAWQLYPHGEDVDQDFLNNLRYTDESLKLFFQKAEQQPWYNNTTFVILADHTRRSTQAKNLKEAFHVPLLIYQAGLNVPAKRHQFVANQLDMLPTIIDLLGFSDSFASMGSSLFRKRNDHSPIVKGNLFGSFTSKGSVLTTGKQLIPTNDIGRLSLLESSNIEQRLKVDFQLAYQAIEKNSWCCKITSSLANAEKLTVTPILEATEAQNEVDSESTAELSE
jgi:phosphoglycerol transferase MdoB-like AlkP superfamily enzyme